MANFWAQVIGTEFGEKEIVKKNFSEEFLSLLDKNMEVKNFDDLDFKPIQKYLEKAKEERNNRTNEEKKKEREQNAQTDAYFRH